eukprot:1159203-Pelagomonas_calceolata.AAC.15
MHYAHKLPDLQLTCKVGIKGSPFTAVCLKKAAKWGIPSISAVQCESSRLAEQSLPCRLEQYHQRIKHWPSYGLSGIAEGVS